MAPTPDEASPMPTDPAPATADDSIVISGMSALMPGCHGLDEFAEKLYNMENLVSASEPRWKCNHPEAEAPLHGLIPDIERFDAQFFMINYRLVNSTDTMYRKMCEQAYQAIIDAGVCPTELSGKRVGVFISTGVTETCRMLSTQRSRGSALLGGSTNMAANRISYWLNAKGPSYTLDASCCGSLVALEMACKAIQHGCCDAALVGGARLSLHPAYAVHYGRSVPISPDSKTKCYDANANGQTISEAITAVFLQKYKDARRVYAEIYHIKSNYGLDDSNGGKLGHYRNPEKLCKFFREFYAEAGVSPSSVEYVEGFGAAISEIDKTELQAMEEVFCKDRKEPLLVGSVSSNMGYAREPSGLCGVIKILLAYQRGKLAANLHCENPRLDIPALQDSRMKIVTRHEPFDRTFTALNGFSVLGLNVHLLLKGHYKNKDVSRYHSKIPYLMTLSGRQESAVQKVMDSIRANELDPEEIALYHAIHKKGIQKHMARGYGIYETINQKTVMRCEKAEYFDDARRPLWFVYSGMGSQWPGMGVQLMRIPIFAAAIERCDKVLKPKGVDIVNIITNTDKSVLDNILNCFVGIAAIQIGLTDILRAVGLVPDHIIGHSVGELGCAYADGCCTAEEMILMAYSRGLVSVETTFIRGSMAAVGIGYQQISKLCPPEIDVACHNGPDSCTISGPADVVHKFVSQLTEQGIFAKEVKCSNIAYHSRYISEAGPKLQQYLKEIVKPKLRSERWLSTSVERDRWHEVAAKYSSAEYHTNNLLRPVLFEETSRLVPSGAVLVEVAPHGLLQAILKRSLAPACRHVPLTRRAHPDPARLLLDALGTLYMAGYDLDVSVLYPRIDFPVASQTRQLSHLVEWVHTEEWSVLLYEAIDQAYTAIYTPKLTVNEEDYKFLEGSIIEGKKVFPLAGALVFVWDTLTMVTEMPLRDTSIEFHNLTVHKQPLLNDTRMLRLVVMLQRGSGQFEVTHEGNLVVEGKIVAIKTNYKASSINVEDAMTLNSSDIYKLLFERGFEYRNDFRSIHCSNFPITRAQLIWKNNWITFIDGALQLCTLRHDHNAISQPQYIQRMCIDVNAHLLTLIHSGENIKDTLVDAVVLEDQNMLRCAGLSIENISFKNKPHHRQAISMQTLNFVPFYQDTNGDIPTVIYMFLQIVAEYFGKTKISILNINNSDKMCVLNEVCPMINGSSIEQIDINVVKEENMRKTETKNVDVVILNKTIDANILETLQQLYPDVFLITVGGNVHSEHIPSSYVQVSAVGKEASRLTLLRRKSKPLSAVAVTVARPEDLQCLVVARANLQTHQKLVAFTTYPPPGDLKQLVKQWRSQPDRNQVFLAMVNDKYKVDLKQLPSFELPFNIFHENTWGGEYYVPFNQRSCDCTAALQCRQPGDVNSLYWLQTPSAHKQAADVDIQVHYAELNSYDAMRVLGRLPINKDENKGFGMSFSGITERGEYVMGIKPTCGSASAQIRVPAHFLWPVPSHWSLEDAATVPLAYSIAFYCLGIKSCLVSGMSLLVHGGAGAVGQAAITVALAAGCRVFTTVSDHNKKTFLTKLFPNLPADHIGNSRNDSFKELIMLHTKGNGCDIVFSCVKGFLKSASLSCCAAGGLAFDLSQTQNQENYLFGMYNLAFSRSYTSVATPFIFDDQNIEEFKKIKLMISEGIRAGYVRPLSRVTYAPHEAARAFRLLAASRHRGRVLLRMHEQLPPAQRRLCFANDSCHVVFCDKDEFGFKLADRLVERGAKKLFLYVPNISSYSLFKKVMWEKLGIEVRITSNALDSIETVRNMFNEANAMGHIEGVHVVATDSDDTLNVQEILYDIDISREISPDLRLFIVMSHDNTIGRNICSMRRQSNLNALFIQLKLAKFADTGVKEDRQLSWRSAADAVEAAMLGGDAVVVINAVHQTLDLLQQVAQLPVVVIKNPVDETATLVQIGIDQSNELELRTLLEEKFDILVQKDKVPSMTLGQLMNLKRQMEDDNNMSGLSGYISQIVNDEVIASTEFVYMPTLTHTPNMQIDEFDNDETFLYIVPGLEDNHERFQEMCELLKLPAVVLHLGMEEYRENLQEIAQRLVEVLMKKLKIKNQFQLLGYEFGVPVVMEMAAILESYGLTGTVYCLGGTAYDIQADLEYKLRGMTEQSLQVALLQHVQYLLLGASTPELQHRLRELPQFSDKVRQCVRELRGRVSHTSQFVDTLMRAAYARLQLLRHCRTHFTVLDAKVIILRAKLHNPSPVEGLKLSHQDIIVHKLESTLAHAPRDLRCSSLINKYLGSDILTKFCKRNRCLKAPINLDYV
uniref:Ketosynthase family 3 (KS3) domain-containing protein n=1 Tax=Heliothis virescens TaxID=7102 RepID=A0A2A4K5B4_HELVI